jgi:hypothetical protein
MTVIFQGRHIPPLSATASSRPADFLLCLPSLYFWRWLFRWYRVRPFMPINLSTDLGVASVAGSTIRMETINYSMIKDKGSRFKLDYA